MAKPKIHPSVQKTLDAIIAPSKTRTNPAQPVSRSGERWTPPPPPDEVTKAAKAVGTSLPSKIAGQGDTRSNEFYGAAREIGQNSPSDWQHVVDGAK